MKYPVSCMSDGRVGIDKVFYKIFTFHFPVSDGNKHQILDPTCGKQYLWKHFCLKSLITGKPILEKYNVIFSDIRDLGQSLVSDFRDLSFNKELDGIVFDPPYFFGVKVSDDPRRDDYGGYNQTYEELYEMIESASKIFPLWLKKGGKVILKCSDQFWTKDRKFYPHHITWTKLFEGMFDLVDIFIHIYHRVSPTAYQVKNRPSSIINHTYFLIFQLKEDSDE